MKRSQKTNNTARIAIVGVFLAISIIALILAGIVPGVELTLYAISGILVVLVSRETNIGGGIFLYVTSLLLGLLVVPNRLSLLPYAFFFGPYGVLRELIERVNNVAAQYILKFIAFNVLIALGLLVFREAFLTNVDLPDLAWPLLILGAEFMFLVYDTIIKLAARVMEQTRRKR